jgi:DNA-binding MarR family transcriptional regulator
MKTVINLLEKFQEYSEKTSQEPNLHDFGVWLQATQRDNSRYTFDKRGIPVDPMIGYYLGNLMGFSEAWSKLALESLPLKSLTDFGILKYVEQHKNPTKRMVAKHALAEETTIFEAIKRLIKIGLLSESANPDDKRSKLVSLTTKGQKVTNFATEKVFNLSRLLVGDLSEEEKQSLLSILEKLQKFHEHMYHQTERAKISEDYFL